MGRSLDEIRTLAHQAGGTAEAQVDKAAGLLKVAVREGSVSQPEAIELIEDITSNAPFARDMGLQKFLGNRKYEALFGQEKPTGEDPD